MNHSIKTIVDKKSTQKLALKTATDYFLRGWQPLAIATRSKNPNFVNWQNFKTIDENELAKHFNGKPQNIGVLLGMASNNLVDIDLDSPTALKIAGYFLPDTNAVFGRESKKRSHFLYYCPDAKTEKFQFSEMIVEIRATGTQTVFPGSTHESGELITWDNLGEPQKISFGELSLAVGKLATASMLADFWKDSKRHDLVLSLSGALLNNGFSFDDAYLFIKAICVAANDEETSDRLKALETTHQRIHENKNVYGLPKLKELTSEKAIHLLCKWLNFSFDQKSENKIINVDEIIENYRLTKQGLFYVNYEKSRSGKVNEIESFICSPLQVVATGKDADDGERTQIVEFTNDDGKTKNINISLRQLITEPPSILGELVANGLIINYREKQKLIDYLIYSRPEKRLTLVYQTGWQGKVFVMPNQIISGKDAENQDYLLAGTHSKINHETKEYTNNLGNFGGYQRINNLNDQSLLEDFSSNNNASNSRLLPEELINKTLLTFQDNLEKQKINISQATIDLYKNKLSEMASQLPTQELLEQVEKYNQQQPIETQISIEDKTDLEIHSEFLQTGTDTKVEAIANYFESEVNKRHDLSKSKRNNSLEF